MKKTIARLALGLLAPAAPAASPADVEAANPGDTLRVEFVLPYEKAVERARAENRLVYLKPIYGGVDAAGYEDYRCGSW